MQKLATRSKRLAATLLAIGLAASMAGCGRSVSSDVGRGAVTLALDWFPQPSNAGAYIAKAKGYYAARSLSVAIQPGSAQAVAIQVVAAGRAQFGLETGAHVIEARARGIPLVAIAATFQTSPAALFFHKGQPIHSFADLNGRTVYTQVAAPQWAFEKTRYHLDKVRDLQFQGSYAAFASDPTAVAQGYLTSTGDELAAQGIATDSIRSPEDIGYASVLFTTEDMIRDHPDTVRAFVSATAHGWADYRTRPAEGARILLPFTAGRTEASLVRESTLQKDFIWKGDAMSHGWGWMTAARWDAAIAELVAEGSIKPMPSSTLFTNQFLVAK